MTRRHGLLEELMQMGFRLPWRLFGAVRVLRKRAGRAQASADAAATSQTAAATLTWREFESLVGELLRRDGFQITAGDAPSLAGGMDLVATKAGGRFVVRCKHWRKQKVGVNFVRELNAAVAAQGARGGIVVTGGQFTYEAREFAHALRIRLIDGTALQELLGAAAGDTGGELDTNAE